MLSISSELLPRFKGFCSSPSVIMLFVYMKCRFTMSYRELEEMMVIRGARIDHATVQRWVKRFVSIIEKRVRQRKKQVNGSWRMDETGSVASVIKLRLAVLILCSSLENIQYIDTLGVKKTNLFFAILSDATEP